MSDVKFTPGPWEAHVHPQKTWVGAADASLGSLAVADVSPIGKAGDQVVANGHLIAAAPDLYSALERAARWLDCYCEPGEVCPLHQARAALAKARGETP